MIKIRYLILGDTHGNTNAATQAVDYARDNNLKNIIQVGDFGAWTHTENGIKFLDTLNERLRLRGVTMRVVGGNHENWDHWDWYVANYPKDYHGFTYLRSHIRIAPKVLFWKFEGKRFLMVGGAVSIDKEYRKEGKSWWAGEQLTDAEVFEAESVGPVDYMFSHDCSNYTPFRARLKPDPDSQRHRQKIDDIIRATKPKIHFHGHMHTKYDWVNGLVHGNSVFDTANSGGTETQTYGLECDGDWDNMGIFNTDTGDFKFRSDLFRQRQLES